MLDPSKEYTLEEIIKAYFYPGPISGAAERLAEGLKRHGWHQ